MRTDPGPACTERQPLEGSRRCVWISLLWLLQQVITNRGVWRALHGRNGWPPLLEARSLGSGGRQGFSPPEALGEGPRHLRPLGAQGMSSLLSARPSSHGHFLPCPVCLLKGWWLLASEPTLNPGLTSHLTTKLSLTLSFPCTRPPSPGQQTTTHGLTLVHIIKLCWNPASLIHRSITCDYF